MKVVEIFGNTECSEPALLNGEEFDDYFSEYSNDSQLDNKLSETHFADLPKETEGNHDVFRLLTQPEKYVSSSNEFKSEKHLDHQDDIFEIKEDFICGFSKDCSENAVDYEKSSILQKCYVNLHRLKFKLVDSTLIVLNIGDTFDCQHCRFLIKSSNNHRRRTMSCVEGVLQESELKREDINLEDNLNMEEDKLSMEEHHILKAEHVTLEDFENLEMEGDVEVKVEVELPEEDVEQESSLIGDDLKMQRSKRNSTISEGGLENQNFKCSKCPMKFSTESGLREHLSWHTDLGSFLCHRCLKCFTRKKAFIAHTKDATCKKPYTCHLCAADFLESYQLEYHMHMNHSDIKSFICSICSKGFLLQNVLDEHMLSHEAPDSQEPKVEKVRSIKIQRKNKRRKWPNAILNRKFLASIEIDEDVSQGNKLSCFYCFEIFKTDTELQNHVQLHLERNLRLCLECGRKFARNSDLITHMCYHKNILPYGCKKCKKSFPEWQKLKTHMRSHRKGNKVQPTDDFPRNCPKCQQLYHGKYQLAKHMNAKHSSMTDICKEPVDEIDVSENQLSKNNKITKKPTLTDNEITKKPTLTENDLSCLQAKLINTIVKYKRCSLCTNKFEKEDDAKDHMLIHFSQKKHHCHGCKKNFECLRIFKKHTSICQYLFQKDSLENGRSRSCKREGHNLDNNLSGKSTSLKKRPMDTPTSKDAKRRKVENLEADFTESESKEPKKMNGNQDQDSLEVQDCKKELPLICVICNKASRDGYTHYMHMLSVHNYDRPLSCKLCFKTQVNLENMRNHLKEHFHAMNKFCIVCRRYYPKERNWIFHVLRRHVKEVPYGCMKCNKEFSSLDDLKKHSNLHHTGEKK